MEQNPSGGALVPNPIDASRDHLTRGLTVAAAGQGSWDEWPGSARVLAMPSLLRVGRVHIDGGDASGYPVVVPLLGENSIVIGDPQLTVPIRPRPVESLHMGKAALIRAQEEAAVANQRRRRQLFAQRSKALGITAGLIARAGGSLPENQLEITVYDPLESGRQFAPLAAMNRHGSKRSDGRMPYIFSEDLPTLLRTLGTDARERFERLGKFKSFRESVQETGEPPAPWRIVALMGAGERLAAADQERLDRLVGIGADAGISFIMSGFGSGTPTVHLELLGGNWAYSSTLPDMKIYLDSAPEPEELAQSVTHSRPVQTGRKHVDGKAYRHAILNRRMQHERAQAAVTYHYQEFPLLTPNFLTNQVALSVEEHSAYMGMIAHSANPYATAIDIVRSVLESGGQPVPMNALTSWAMLELMQSAGEAQRHRLREVSLRTVAGKYVHPYIEGLTQLITATTPGGLEHLGVDKDMRAYIAQYVPRQVPAWMYQLVADRATTSRLSLIPGRNTALDAICRDLEYVFYTEEQGAELPDLHHNDNQALREALVELRLFDLYGFADPGTPEPLRNLLARRAGRRLAHITREQLPAIAHILFDTYQDFLKTQEAAHNELPVGIEDNHI